MILFVLSGMCPVGYRNLFGLSLRLVIFRLQSWYAHNVAQSQSHQLSALQLELELGQATCSTVSASVSLCTWGIGACAALAREPGYSQDTYLHQGDGMHLWVPWIRCSHSLLLRSWGSNITFISDHCLPYNSSLRACHYRIIES